MKEKFQGWFLSNTEHPKDTLLFYIAGRWMRLQRSEWGNCSTGWLKRFPWIIHPPYFVHQTEETVDPESGEPVITVGGVLEFYTAHPPWRDRLPREVDEAHYREMRLLVDRLCSQAEYRATNFISSFMKSSSESSGMGSPMKGWRCSFLGAWARALGIG